VPGDVKDYGLNANTAIYDGRLFIRYSTVYCFDVRADIPYTGQRACGDGVFVTASPPIQWGMARNFGWKQALPSAGGSAPVADAGRLFTTERPGSLVCRSATDGSVLWNQDFPSSQAGTSEPASPIVRGSNVYAVLPDGRVVACNVKGELLWSVGLDSDRAPQSPVLGAAGPPEGDARGWAARSERGGPGNRTKRSPVLFRDLLLVPGTALAALDAKSGKTVWTREKGGAVASVACVYAGGEPAVLTDSGALLSLPDGREIERNVLGKGGPFLLAADVQECLAYAVSRSQRKYSVVCSELPRSQGQTSRLRWKTEVAQAGPATPPVLHDGRLYVVGLDRVLTVLDAKTGKDVAHLPLDTDRTSSPVTEPYLSVAGRRLYVQNVGKQNRTVVVQPGPKPSVVWQYACSTPSSALAFLDESLFARAGATLWCMRGRTPVEPRDPGYAALEPQSFLAGPDVKAPIVPFADRTVPGKWLLAGPCYPSTLETNFLASLGPVKDLAIREGLSHRAGYTTITFRPSASNDFWQSEHSANMPAFDFTLMTSRRPGTLYAYTVVENEKGRYVEYNPIGPNQTWRDFGDTVSAKTWLSGMPIDQGSVFLLKKGRHGLLIQAAIGKPPNDWGKIFMIPHLMDVHEKALARLKQYAEDQAFWTAYAKTKDELIVLKP
jgi:outer membrane protein assembly factor BamB